MNKRINWFTCFFYILSAAFFGFAYIQYYGWFLIGYFVPWVIVSSSDFLVLIKNSISLDVAKIVVYVGGFVINSLFTVVFLMIFGLWFKTLRGYSLFSFAVIAPAVAISIAEPGCCSFIFLVMKVEPLFGLLGAMVVYWFFICGRRKLVSG